MSVFLPSYLLLRSKHALGRGLFLLGYAPIIHLTAEQTSSHHCCDVFKGFISALDKPILFPIYQYLYTGHHSDLETFDYFFVLFAFSKVICSAWSYRLRSGRES